MYDRTWSKMGKLTAIPVENLSRHRFVILISPSSRFPESQWGLQQSSFVRQVGLKRQNKMIKNLCKEWIWIWNSRREAPAIPILFLWAYWALTLALRTAEGSMALFDLAVMGDCACRGEPLVREAESRAVVLLMKIRFQRRASSNF